MFVGVVELHYYVVLITECHNSHKHSKSHLTMILLLQYKLKVDCIAARNYNYEVYSL